MCLAIPGKLISTRGEGIEREGVVDFEGARKSVNLAFAPQAKVDDYVLVHVGFAISTIDESEVDALYQFIEDSEQ